jgi:flagellar biosynthetic protein FliR
MTISVALGAVGVARALLASVRVLAWMSVVPPFSARYMPRQVRAAAALAIGLVAGPHLALEAVPTWQGLIVDAVGQVLMGAGFGALTMIVLEAVVSAGGALGLFGGLVLPQALEPVGQSPTNSLGQLYQVATFALLVASGGDLLLLRGLFTTFRVFGPTLGSLAPMAHGALGATATMFAATFEVAGPIIAVEFLAQLVLGLLAKAAPNVNIFLFMFSVQVAVLVFALALGAGSLPDAVARLVEKALGLEGGLL